MYKVLMAKRHSVSKFSSNLTITRITRSVYFLLGFYALSIIIFDSGNLITREAVIQRWSLASVVLLINTLVWLIASGKNRHITNHMAVYILTAGFITFAGFTTYWERGMASTSTVFYILPLLVVATIKNRHALLATAVLSAGTYAFTTVKYFNDFFNEGYRIQLWGHIVLYSGTILVSAWLIMIVAGLRHDSK